MTGPAPGVLVVVSWADSVVEVLVVESLVFVVEA